MAEILIKKHGEKEAWQVLVEGHSVIVVTQGKAHLYFDGREVESDKRDFFEVPLDDDRVLDIFVIRSTMSTDVRAIIGTAARAERGLINKDNEFRYPADDDVVSFGRKPREET